MRAKLALLPCPACGAAARVSERRQHSPGDTGWFLIECSSPKNCLGYDNLPSSHNGRKDSAIREWNRHVKASASEEAIPR